MKNFLLIAILFFVCHTKGMAQEKRWANPIIKDYGRILDLENVDVKPDPEMEYKILIELVHKMDNPERINFSSSNVARLVNLHAIGGVKPENLKVVVVIHAEATNAVVNNEAYKKRYEHDNPYIPLYKELASAGVELIVCGQSLNLYNNNPEDVIPEVKIATSALTAVSTYQLLGYAYFKWD